MLLGTTIRCSLLIRPHHTPGVLLPRYFSPRPKGGEGLGVKGSYFFLILYTLNPSHTAARKNNATMAYVMASGATITSQTLAPKHIVTNTNESIITINFAFSILLVKLPAESVLSVLDLKSERCKIVTDKVAGCPVLIRLCLGSLLEQHVYDLAKCFLTGIVAL